LFHEEGHWVDFINSNLSGEEYMERDYPYRYQYKMFEQKILEMPNDSPSKHHLAKKCVTWYNEELPIELAANTYAIQKIKESINLIRALGQN
jgi:hypothetical protein